MVRRHGVEQVTPEEQKKYVKDFIESSEILGATTGEIVEEYKTEKHVAKRGSGRSGRIMSIVKDTASLEKEGEAFLHHGRYISSKYSTAVENFEKFFYHGKYDFPKYKAAVENFEKSKDVSLELFS